MSEMIERVAKVLAAYDNGGATLEWGAMLTEGSREEFRYMARAAIEAMRNPTAEMLYFGVGNKDARQTWNLMIDAALADKPSPSRTSTCA